MSIRLVQMLTIAEIVGCSGSLKDSAVVVDDFGCEDSGDIPHTARPAGWFGGRRWVYSTHRRLESCDDPPGMIDDNAPVDFDCYALDDAIGVADRDRDGVDDQFVAVPVPMEDGVYRTGDSGLNVTFVHSKLDAPDTRVTHPATVRVVTEGTERRVGICSYGSDPGYRSDYVLNGTIEL